MNNKYIDKGYVQFSKLKQFYHTLIFVIIAFLISALISSIIAYLVYLGLCNLYTNKVISECGYNYCVAVAGSIIGTIVTVLYAYITSRRSFYNSVKYNRYNFLTPQYNFLIGIIKKSYNLTDTLDKYNKGNKEHINSDNIKESLSKLIDDENKLSVNLNRVSSIGNDFPNLQSHIKRYKGDLDGEKHCLTFLSNILGNTYRIDDMLNLIRRSTMDLTYLQWAIGNLAKINSVD